MVIISYWVLTKNHNTNRTWAKLPLVAEFLYTLDKHTCCCCSKGFADPAYLLPAAFTIFQQTGADMDWCLEEVPGVTK